MTTTQAPHPLALTAAGKRLADALVKAEIIFESGDAYDPFIETLKADELNAAAEILMPAEGAGLREALVKAERALKPFANRVYNDNGDISVSDTFRCGLDEFTAAYFAHRTCVTALASPQPAVEGPVAAGVGEVPDGWQLVPIEATEKMFQAGLDAPGDKRPLDWERKDVPEYMPWVWTAMLHAAPSPLTLTPPADPKPTVPGNDAGMREALDEIEEGEIEARARALIDEAGWKPGDKFHIMAVLGLMTRLGQSLAKEPPARCNHPECGCDADAVCGAVPRPLAPQTGSAGEDPKTPDAGVGEPYAWSILDEGRVAIDDYVEYERIELASQIDAAELKRFTDLGRARPLYLAQPAPVGEDETGVENGLKLRERPDGTWGFGAAPQPPKAETPAIPVGVYYSDGNFYDMTTRKGLGTGFYVTWGPRHSEFPTSPKAETPAGAGELIGALKRIVGMNQAQMNAIYRAEEMERIARAALSAAPAARPGGGFVLVPREPTENMLAAGKTTAETYHAMIWARPPLDPPPAEAARPGDAVAGWQPIETAPEDGRWVLLYARDRFAGEDEAKGRPVEVRVRSAYFDTTIQRWSHPFSTHFPPTHWRPLPAPPVPAAAPAADGGRA